MITWRSLLSELISLLAFTLSFLRLSASSVEVGGWVNWSSCRTRVDDVQIVLFVGK